MAKRQTIEDRIKEIILTKILSRRTLAGISENQPLGTNGVGLDSLEFLKLLTCIEKEFSIQIEDDYWSQELLNDISKIANYVRERLRASQGEKERII